MRRKIFLTLKTVTLIALVGVALFGFQIQANRYSWTVNLALDKDRDLIPDDEEILYKTNPNEYDTDRDGYLDGDEVNRGFDPLIPGLVPLASPPNLPGVSVAPGEKVIEIDLSDQRLTYYEGNNTIGSFLISSANASYSTPTGEFKVQAKRPVVLYAGANRDGSRYYYPNTKWNLQFLPHYYIHGAYWHNNFGRPMSHGCVNVSYTNMENLYNWASVGTRVVIHQ